MRKRHRGGQGPHAPDPLLHGRAMDVKPCPHVATQAGTSKPPPRHSPRPAASKPFPERQSTEHDPKQTRWTHRAPRGGAHAPGCRGQGCPGGRELIPAGPPVTPPAHAPASAGTSAQPSTAALDAEDEWEVTRHGAAPRSGLFLIIPSVFPSRCSLRLLFKSTARLPRARPERDPAKCHQTGDTHTYIPPPQGQ